MQLHKAPVFIRYLLSKGNDWTGDDWYQGLKEEGWKGRRTMNIREK
jgi:hypothetical protein